MSGPQLVWARPRTRAALLGGAQPVQTPAAPATPLHPDQRMADAVRAAWWSGHDMAERRYYTSGWRTGLGHGLLWGLVLGVGGTLAAPWAWRSVAAAWGL